MAVGVDFIHFRRSASYALGKASRAWHEPAVEIRAARAVVTGKNRALFELGPGLQEKPIASLGHLKHGRRPGPGQFVQRGNGSQVELLMLPAMRDFRKVMKKRFQMVSLAANWRSRIVRPAIT
jgi:hypothetical protein